VARLSERNSWLRLALGSREDELLRTQASLQAARAEKETLQRDVSGQGPAPPPRRQTCGEHWLLSPAGEQGRQRFFAAFMKVVREPHRIKTRRRLV
jgi:hypothetical protein